jgi:tRNA(Ile)-lysidine synthase
MLEHLDFTLQHNCRLDRQGVTLVAVSGGPDSLCLLRLLHQLDYPLIVAHLDHGLRPESAAEATRVQQIAESLGVRYVWERQDVQHYADQHRLSIEEAARNVRYRFLFEQAEKLKAQAVAVGHTADDQVETVLMHLLRGAGVSGLRGMSYYSLPNPWSQEIPLVRPLLGVWREEILEYLKRQGLQPNLDASNLDRRYYRNRLRHELIPHLEALNPGARRRIWITAALLRDEDEMLERLVETAWGRCCLVEGKDALAFDLSALRSQPIGMQRRLMRRAIAQLRPGLRNIDFEDVERALNFLTEPARSGQTDLTANLRLELEGQRLWIADWQAELKDANWPQLSPGETLDLAVPGDTHLSGGWRFSAETLLFDEVVLAQAQANADPYQAWLDLERLARPLTVRTRRPGDRFRPLGMHGRSLKLSDFMVNVRLPRQAREGWPLLTAGEEIVWVPGYRIAEPARVGKHTRHIVRVNLSVAKAKDAVDSDTN